MRTGRVRDLPPHGRGVGSPALVLAGADPRRRLARTSSTCSPPRTETACADAGAGRAAAGRPDARPAVHAAPAAHQLRSTGRSPGSRSPSGSSSCAIRRSRTGCWRRTRARRAGDRAAGRVLQSFGRMSEVLDPPDYEPQYPSSIAARAQRTGRAPMDLAYDLLLEDDGRGMLYVPLLNYADGNLDAAGEMLAHPDTIVGLGDGGAHVGTICDASFPTTLLTQWARDRDHGRMELPFLVHRQTQAHRARGRTARPRGDRARLPRRCQRDRLRAAVRCGDRRCATTCRPADVGSCRLPTATRRRSSPEPSPTSTASATGPLPGRLVRGPASGTDRRRTSMSATDTTTTVDPSELVPLEPACEWRSADLGDRYVYELTEPITSPSSTPRSSHAEAHTDDVLDITRELFPLPTLGAELDPPRRRAHRRRGRGAHPRRARRALHEGARVGDLLGHRDVPGPALAAEREGPPARRRHRPGQGAGRSDRRAATRSVGIAFPFHSDGSDLVGLFCLDAGAGGGASLVANTLTIHNELVRDRARARGRALRAVPVRPAGRAGAGRAAVVHDADLQPLRRPAVRAVHPPVHRGEPSPSGRAATVRGGA